MINSPLVALILRSPHCLSLIPDLRHTAGNGRCVEMGEVDGEEDEDSR